MKKKQKLIKNILRLDLDILSLSNGIYDLNKRLIYPPKSLGHGAFINLATPFAEKYPDILWNIAGNIWNLRKIPVSIPDNLTFSIGRSLIADPAFIEKSLSNNFKDINWCDRDDKCHYFTHGLSHLICPKNPEFVS